MKRLRESIENNALANAHFSQINGLQSEIVIEDLDNEESIHALFNKFIVAAIQLTRFVKIEVNGVNEEVFKTPYRKNNKQNYASSEVKSRMASS